MPQVMEGVITIVQEGRFQMQDDAGVWHLFILGPAAAAESGQLVSLERRKRRVRVRCAEAGNVIGNVATNIVTLD